MPYTGLNAGIRYGWALDEDGWDAEQNEDNRKIDTLLARKVKNRGLDTPPGSPSGGDCHIVGTSPTGAWAGRANDFALYDGNSSSWVFYDPKKGWDVFVEDEGRTAEWNGTVWHSRGSILAANFATVQAAIDKAEALGGGKVELPPIQLTSGTVPAFTPITIPENVEVYGHGDKTILHMSGQSTSLTAVTLDGQNAVLRSLKIQSQNASGSGYGLKIAAASGVIRGPVVEDVRIDGSPSWAIVVGDAGADVVLAEINRVHVVNSKSNGSLYLGPKSFATNVRQCNLEGCASGATAVVHFDGCSHTTIYGGTIEPPPTAVDVVGLRVNANGAAFAKSNSLIAAWMEFHDTTSSQPMIEISGSGQIDGLLIQGCNMVRPITNKAPRPFKSATTSGAGTAIAIAIRDCLIQENGGGPYSDDINLAGVGHDEIVLENNRVYDISSAVSRALSVTGSNNLGVVRIADARRVQVGRFSNASLPTGALRGELAYDTTNEKLVVWTGGAWTAVH